jgi:hypothetical protein
MIVIFGVSFAISQENEKHFEILSDERSIFEIGNFHLDFLGFVLKTPSPISALRMLELKAPGDYFRHPRGADSVQLTTADIKEIESTIKNTIAEQYYDSYILDNMAGYEYNLLNGKISRREYYVKYSRGDTVYVISGLLGKFLSFYRAVPGESRLSIDQLKVEAAKLSPGINFKEDDIFIEKENEYIYFTERVDREQKLRVRNYQVVEYWQETDKERDNPLGKYYNLIEITKFLDEEAMP